MRDQSVVTQLRSLELQLAVLKSRWERALPEHGRAFAELCGMLAGKVSTTEEEIHAVRFRFKWDKGEE